MDNGLLRISISKNGMTNEISVEIFEHGTSFVKEIYNKERKIRVEKSIREFLGRDSNEISIEIFGEIYNKENWNGKGFSERDPNKISIGIFEEIYNKENWSGKG